ncbi:MAG: Poly-beta-1,6-N-acetyl-D-glucosamine N-deacetylase precursor [Firmicutes bacterium ADurb.Bin193]|nr:MAG: Poly-beta-1,6-N-acetyl-D-glucosamine N-deacetylase precursor [Firmicutes bacterium ADurb.Bin193]
MQKIARNTLFITMTIIISINLVLLTAKGEKEQTYIPVLLYHNITENTDGMDIIVNITPRRFREHMVALKSAGYNTITLDDYYEHIQNGKSLPEKPVIITFDDGYLSNYEFAYPILQELEMKATIFIVTDSVGPGGKVSYPHFTWEQARQMQQSGVIDIQSHTHTHRDVTLQNREETVREIRLSKYLIESNLNKECSYLAYPYGAYNNISIRLASEAGYKMMLGLVGRETDGQNNPDRVLKRITVWGDKGGEDFLRFLEDGVKKQNPADAGSE